MSPDPSGSRPCDQLQIRLTMVINRVSQKFWHHCRTCNSTLSAREAEPVPSLVIVNDLAKTLCWNNLNYIHFDQMYTENKTFGVMHTFGYNQEVVPHCLPAGEHGRCSVTRSCRGALQSQSLKTVSCTFRPFNWFPAAALPQDKTELECGVGGGHCFTEVRQHSREQRSRMRWKSQSEDKKIGSSLRVRESPQPPPSI